MKNKLRITEEILRILSFLSHGSNFVKIIRHRFFRCRCDQGNQHNRNTCQDECRKQFIDIQHAAHGTDSELPDKDHGAADDHACEGTLAVRASPEQGEQHQRTERRAEAGPCEGDDTEYRALRIPGKEHADHSDDQEAAAGNFQVSFAVKLQSEETGENILGDRTGSCQKL